MILPTEYSTYKIQHELWSNNVETEVDKPDVLGPIIDDVIALQELMVMLTRGEEEEESILANHLKKYFEQNKTEKGKSQENPRNYK